MIVRIALAGCLALVAVPATAQENVDRLKIINCCDAERNIVRRTAVWKCKGEAVTDDRARAIKASRIRRAKGRMQPANCAEIYTTGLLKLDMTE